MAAALLVWQPVVLPVFARTAGVEAASSSASSSASSPASSPASSDASRATTLDILVVTAEDIPIEAAQVVAVYGAIERSVRTDSLGHARFIDVLPGAWQVAVRLVGFEPVLTEAIVQAGDNRFTVQIDRIEIPLALPSPPATGTPAAGTPAAARDTAQRISGVRVTATPDVPVRLRDFENRVRRGEPSAVITRADIDKRNPIRLSSMLRSLPGVQMGDSAGNKVAISTRGMKVTRDSAGGIALVQCVMRIAIDGVIMPAYADIDAIIPKDVHGVEVYNGPARIPPALGGSRTDNWCGMILIWTRGD